MGLEQLVITKSGIRLGVALPQSSSEGSIDVERTQAFARRAEALGFDDLWTVEQITGRIPVLEPLLLLANIAAITTRIRLGVAVVVANLRNPVQLAKAFSSLDQMSGGRVMAGIGLGPGTSAYPAYGIEADHRVSRFIESIDVMQALWTEKEARYAGRFFKLDGVAMEPKPLQRPLPLWVGARSVAALARGVRYGSGWIGAGSEAMPEFLNELATVRRLLEENGRASEHFALSKRVYMATGSEPEAAHESMRRWTGAFYGDPGLADKWAIWGTPEECVEKLGPLVEAGVNHLVLNPVADELEQLEIIAADIAPKI